MKIYEDYTKNIDDAQLNVVKDDKTTDNLKDKILPVNERNVTFRKEKKLTKLKDENNGEISNSCNNEKNNKKKKQKY